MTLNMEEHTIISDGLRLQGRSCRPEQKQIQQGSSAPLLILCHGIPGASRREQNTAVEEDGGYQALAERCLEEGFHVFHFNFRGAGDSEGNFDLAGWRRDLKAVLDYWEKEQGMSTFLLWGFSAGGAVSCCVAAADPRIKALVMAAAPAEFFSLFAAQERELFLELMRERGIIRDPAFPAAAGDWLRDIYAASPLFFVHNIHPRPLLLMHGSRDELVHCRHAFRLYKAAGPSAELVILPGGKHQLRRYPPAIDRCLQWLKQLTVDNGN